MSPNSPDSLEMLPNCRLKIIFPQNFEGLVVLSVIYNCPRDVAIKSFFMRPCFVGLVFFFSLTGSFENILSLVFRTFLMVYHGMGFSSSIVLGSQRTLSFWKVMSFCSGTFSSPSSLISTPSPLFSLFDPFS